MTNPKPALTCAIVNLKPGTGKTTSAMWLSTAWHQLHRSVLGVDADRGASFQRWADMTGGLPWSVMGYAHPTIRANIVTVTQRMTVDTVVIDCPQMEDHEKIVRPALEYADVWVVPLAPSPIELDRMMAVTDQMDQIDFRRPADRPGRRLVLLNRTNRRRRSQDGPDRVCADILTERGFEVLNAQIPHNDTRYRQGFGYLPDVDDDDPYMHAAREIVALTVAT